MPDTINVEMPQLGETVTEGTVTRWLKSVGESVARDEPLFEISTDKVDSEVPSPASGILTQILVQEGETVSVGTNLAILSTGESASDISSNSPTDVLSTDQSANTGPLTGLSTTQISPPSAAETYPPSLDLPTAQVVPPTPPSYNDTITKEKDNLAAPTSGGFYADPDGDGNTSHGTTSHGTVTSPLVRRLIAETGIDPSMIHPTGPGGRITREDILSHRPEGRQGDQLPEVLPGQAEKGAARAEQVQVQQVQAEQLAPQQQGQQQGQGVTGIPLAGSDEIIPFDNIRRRTAEHMVMSKATSPHTLISLEADYEAVEQVRRMYGERFRSEEGYTLSYLPFAARAAVEALKQWPRLNSSVVGDSLIVHHMINLGIAVDINHDGLIVPVVHRADDLTLRGMARHIHDLATRARTRRLTADDISGGTFSITNAGPYGTFMTVAIINQPQVAILATDGVKRKPVVVMDSFGSESIAIHSVGILAMSFDHRAVDGAYVAAFLSTMSSILATHDFIAEL